MVLLLVLALLVLLPDVVPELLVPVSEFLLVPVFLQQVFVLEVWAFVQLVFWAAEFEAFSPELLVPELEVKIQVV